MEEGKQAKRMVTSWAFIGVVFIGIIVFLSVKFMHRGGESASLQTQDKLMGYVNTWAGVARSELSCETESGKVFADEIARLGYQPGDEDTVKYATSLVANTDVSHVIFCNSDGVICDESGSKDIDVNLSLFSATEPREYNITEAYGKKMFTAYVPVGENGDYMLIMEDLDSVGSLFASSTYEEVSFLSVVNKNGVVLGTFSRNKDTDSAFLTSSNVSISISNGTYDAEDFNLFKVKLYNGLSCALKAEYQNDSRTILFSPMGVEDWYLAYGIRQSYVDKIEKTYFGSVKSTVIDLIVVIAIFAVFVVSSVVFNSLRTKERGRVLEDKADTDLLTELNNKAATERKIQEYLEDNPNGRAMMFILDIDNFKKINDTMGHAFGDTLLKTLGKEIRTEFRMTDIIGRTGGDEFMVFLKDVTDDLIVEREANRITRFFHDFKAGGDYVKYSATASIGAAIFPDDAKNFKDLYVAADQALYRAKKRGKNQLCFYNEAAHK